MRRLMEDLASEDITALATEGLLSMGLSQEEIDSAVSEMSPEEAKQILGDLSKEELDRVLESAAVPAGLLQEAAFVDYADEPAYMRGQKPISRQSPVKKASKLGMKGLALVALLALGAYGVQSHKELSDYRPIENAEEVMRSQYASSGAREQGISFRSYIRQNYKIEKDFEGKIGFIWNWDACKKAGLVVPETDAEAMPGENDFWYLDENPFDLSI